jgi:hypothetical protein
MRSPMTEHSSGGVDDLGLCYPGFRLDCGKTSEAPMFSRRVEQLSGGHSTGARRISISPIRGTHDTDSPSPLEVYF